MEAQRKMLLSRVANDIYWMSRYVERAENIARFIDANWHLMLDLPDEGTDLWEPLIQVTGDSELFHEKYEVSNQFNVIQFLVFDQDYANSIYSCVNCARENARAVREQISPAMWEQLNSFYHLVLGAASQPETVQNNPQVFLNRVRENGTMLGGLADDTMSHGEGWHFFRMARLLERAEKTSRILDVKYFIILPDVDYVGSAYDAIQWAALLRSTSGLETFRQHHGKITPDQVVDFLLLDRYFPRAVQACLRGADYSLRAISGTMPGQYVNSAEQSLGRVCSDLGYTDSETVMKVGLHEFIDDLQIKLNYVDLEIYHSFFDVFPGS